MTLKRLGHVNLRTGKLAAMIAFYRDLMGLEPGERPPFNFDGCWLYCGGQPVIHLVKVTETPAGTEPRIEHFAFEAEGLAAFLEKLRAAEVAYRIGVVPEWQTRQVNFHDPDGNHIHCDFAAHEEADLTPYP